MGVVSRIIKKQPNFIKKIYYNLIPFNKRYGETYNDTSNFLDEVDLWGYDRTRQYQLDKLKNVLIVLVNQFDNQIHM